MSQGRRLALAVLVLMLLALPSVASARSFGSRTLHKGNSGSDVEVLQDLLTQAGHSTTVDGEFGGGTKRSVKAWESDAERRVNGRVTRGDARALKATAASAGSGADEEPVPDDPISDPDEAAKEAYPTGGAGYAPVRRAKINRDGTAVAPSSAPAQVKAIIAAGNRIHRKDYRYGGGHASFKDSGYDCSGSVSYALHGARLLRSPLDSTGLESWATSGPGSWVTVYANAGHTYMVVAGLRFDTSGASSRGGSRWTREMRPSSGYVVRHPSGL